MKARPCDVCGNFNPKAEKCLYNYMTIDPRTGMCDKIIPSKDASLDHYIKEAPRQ